LKKKENLAIDGCVEVIQTEPLWQFSLVFLVDSQKMKTRRADIRPLTTYFVNKSLYNFNISEIAAKKSNFFAFPNVFFPIMQPLVVPFISS